MGNLNNLKKEMGLKTIFRNCTILRETDKEVFLTNGFVKKWISKEHIFSYIDYKSDEIQRLEIPLHIAIKYGLF